MLFASETISNMSLDGLTMPAATFAAIAFLSRILLRMIDASLTVMKEASGEVAASSSSREVGLAREEKIADKWDSGMSKYLKATEREAKNIEREAEVAKIWKEHETTCAFLQEENKKHFKAVVERLEEDNRDKDKNE